jgi:DNA polymerase elongation subunit (family B)
MSNFKTFQIVDILSDDWTKDRTIPMIDKKGKEKKDKDGNPKTQLEKYKEFVLTMYGIDENDKRVVCNVYGYKPYFFIKIPNNWTTDEAKTLIKNISKVRIHKRMEIIIAKDFYGVQWNPNNGNIQTFNFMKIFFNSYSEMRKFINETKKFYNTKEELSGMRLKIHKEWKETRSSINNDSNLYESSIHPIIKFIHDTGVDPTGWIQINNTDKGEYKSRLFTQEEYTTSYKEISKHENDKPSNYRVASFDIECDSLHGDFPMAIKNYKKFSSEIFDSYQNLLKKIGNIYNTKLEINLTQLFTYGFLRDKTNLTESKLNLIDINSISLNKLPTKEIIENIVYKIMNDEPDETGNKRNKITDDIKNTSLKSKERDASIKAICDIIEEEFKDENIIHLGDPIIQIGTVFYDYSKDETFRHILVIGNKEGLNTNEICDDLEGITVQKCDTEKDLLLGWRNIIKKMDPDFITGYNIFGFDFKYIYDRASVLFPCHDKCTDYYHVKGCPMKEFLNFGKMDSRQWKAKDHYSKKCIMKTQKLSSSALGDNTLNYIVMDGRILFDIQKEVQKGHNLESYKLDNVAAHFMRGKLKSIIDKTVSVSDTGHLKNGDYVSFRTHNNIGEELFEDGKKFKILRVEPKTLILQDNLKIDLSEYHKVEWCLNKDDISPQDIFDKHKEGGPSGRAEVAKYCVQDCELCIHLLMLLDIIPNNLGMANVSYVPASYIFLRGQGVKVTSVVSRVCAERNTKIPELMKIPRLNDYIKMYRNGSSDNDIREKMSEDEGGRSWEREEWLKRVKFQAENGIEGYEGAIVLDPTPGIYLDDPVSVLDYASLYPSSIIEKNISHETLIEDPDLLEDIGEENYYTIKYQDWIYRNKGKGDTIEKIDAGTQTTCYFMKPEYMKSKGMFQEGEKEMGIIPAVLQHLLDARKRTRGLIKKTDDEFKKKVLDGLQLAYKVTANSVYGQLGAKTSTVFKMSLAACTTSIGRSRIDDASRGVKLWAEKKGYPEPDVVYGDTDSVFVKFSRYKDGKLLEGKEALKHCIECGQEAGEYITKGILKLEDADGDEEIVEEEPLLCHPQDLEYEKTFWPFILISKKRYTGDKYEYSTEECKRTSMGIVLKRRDNAPIVKHVFGNVIEKIMIEKDFNSALEWLKQTLLEVRNAEFSLRYFVITKSLRGYYKNPQSIAHKVLADRMAIRDPGNKPKSNDRIPYAYIQLTDDILYDYENPYKSGSRKGQPRLRNVKQGDRIEHVDYIKDKKLSLDYEFYITNQIMNPVKQVLDLEMDSKETEKLFLK